MRIQSFLDRIGWDFYSFLYAVASKGVVLWTPLEIPHAQRGAPFGIPSIGAYAQHASGHSKPTKLFYLKVNVTVAWWPRRYWRAFRKLFIKYFCLGHMFEKHEEP